MIRHTNFQRTAKAATIASFVASVFLVNVAQAAPVAAPTPKPTPKATPKPAATPTATATATSKPKPVAAPTATPAATSSTPSAEAVATVNGEAILKKDVERLLAVAIKRDKRMQGTGEEAKKKVAAARSQIVTDRIDLALWTQEAKKRKITAPAGEVDKVIKQNKTAFANDAQWRTFLGSRTDADYRRTVAQELAVTELFARLTADVKVSDDDIQAYYNANKEKFRAPEMVRVHHMFFIAPQAADAAEKARVMARAQDVMKKAQAPGASFEALAREYSDDNNVMQDSGALPIFWRDRLPLPKEFQDAAFSGEVGQIVGPVQTPMGIHIIRIDEKVPSAPAPLTRNLKTDIEFSLKTLKNDELLQKVLNDMKTKADIQIK